MLNNLVMKDYVTLAEASEILGKSKETLRRWDREGKLSAVREPMSNYRVYKKEQLSLFSDFVFTKSIKPISNFTSVENEYAAIELFAGAGGLAVGLEKVGIKCVALNEIDKWAGQTLRNIYLN